MEADKGDRRSRILLFRRLMIVLRHATDTLWIFPFNHSEAVLAGRQAWVSCRECGKAGLDNELWLDC